MGRAVKVVVTGGGGFIGSHLVDRLLRDGHEVRVVDNFATGRRENLAGMLGDIELVEGDIQSYERAHTAVRGTEVVLHQAALPSVPRSVQDPLTSNASNVIGTLTPLCRARQRREAGVYASSSSVYGSNPVLPKHEELAPLPISPYAVTKLAGEGYARSFYEVYGLETLTLRYFNVLGPARTRRPSTRLPYPTSLARSLPTSHRASSGTATKLETSRLSRTSSRQTFAPLSLHEEMGGSTTSRAESKSR